MIQQKQEGDIHVECILKFKGKVRATLWDSMSVEELVSEIIYSGDFEYEVTDGDFAVDNIDTFEDYLD